MKHEVEDRFAAGKTLREKCAREAHAGWKAPADRRDPVDLLVESSAGRLPQLIPIRYGRMTLSPFTFYRGAAAIMAADLARTPSSGIRVQACGDCHLMNFGGFATPERHIVFDINDFDETLPAPWEWDVKRLATSFVVAGYDNGFSKSEAREVATLVVRHYREHLRRYAHMGVLERWYERIDTDDLIETLKTKRWKDWMQAQVDKAASRNVLEDDFPKLASVVNGKVRIKDNPPLIFHATENVHEYLHFVDAAYRRYRETLSEERKALLDQFEFQDIAAKVVGIGSVGTACGVFLLMAGKDDPLFLQVKEARPSVLEAYAGKSRFPNHGQRVVAGQRLMQAASDMFLGWTEDRGRNFYIRQLRDIKIKPLVEVADVARLQQYAQWCGWALARAHAKAGDAALISGYLGTGGRFDDAVAKFALDYAEQNALDHQALRRAIASGRIEAMHE
ncbi:DUF2252 domain-containing protein [Variovorax sp. YR216]|uniref:DUF2252 domain-containing protein n=1 Tax=Variovorax sp. YR216 TaxID=1882828 RepID=UPI0008951A54|nr:DUF2252 domain-containing protein [Variovorax sp. YR216]SEB18954.1 Uncharacterized conserved protein, DUF2252 family [Variovorax sp. YR216]